MPNDFSAEDAARVTTALRAELGLEPQTFPPEAFVGMISDEIEQLRRAGKRDEDIAEMVERVTGKPLSAEMLAKFYATPERRGYGAQAARS